MNDIQKEELNILLEFDRICRIHDIKYSLAFGTLLGAIRHKGFIPWDDDVDIMLSRNNYDKFISVVAEELDNENYVFVDHNIEQKFYYGFAKIRSRNLMMPEKSTQYLGIEQGVWIDIFPFDAVPDDQTLAIKQKNRIKRYHKFFVAFVFTYAKETDKGFSKIVKVALSKLNRKTQNLTKLRRYVYKLQNNVITKYNNTTTKRYNALGSNYTEKEYSGGMLSLEQLNNLMEVEFEGHIVTVIKDYEIFLTGVYGDYMTLPDVQDRVSVHDVELND